MASLATSAQDLLSRTQADGSLSLAQLQLATYLVTVAAPGYLGASREVTINSASETTIEIRLKPVPATLSGVVLHSDTEAPVVGARVALGDWSAVTDERGRYQLMDLPFGVYPLQVAADGFVVHEATIVVDAGSARIHDVRLAPATGTLVIRVIDAVTGAPIENASVTCASDDELPCADYGLLVPLKRSQAYGGIRKRVADPKPVDAWQHSGLHFFSFALKPTEAEHRNGDVHATSGEAPIAVFAMHPFETDPVSAVVVSPASDGGAPAVVDLRATHRAHATGEASVESLNEDDQSRLLTVVLNGAQHGKS